MVSPANSITFRGVNAYPSETISKISEERIFPNSFNEGTITLILNPDKYTTHTHTKKITVQYH